MTRPSSHREQNPTQRCSNCVHSRLVAYKLDLLCFHGDRIEIVGQSEYPVSADYVYLDGEEVGMMDGEEYSPVWADRVVEPSDVCDEWAHDGHEHK